MQASPSDTSAAEVQSISSTDDSFESAAKKRATLDQFRARWKKEYLDTGLAEKKFDPVDVK